MNFDITLQPIRDNLQSIFLKIPFSYKEIIKEIETEDWSNTKTPESKRHVLIEPSSPILKEVKSFLSSNYTKEKVINSFYTNFPDIKTTWNGWDETEMSQNTLWDCAFIKDRPGFYMDPHLDTRVNVGTAIIYLNQHWDETRTTIFYTDKDLNNEIKIDNNFCQGVISVNDYNTWHSIRNDSLDDRYVIVCVLMLLTKSESLEL